jgi:hypothetical protein
LLLFVLDDGPPMFELLFKELGGIGRSRYAWPVVLELLLLVIYSCLA